MTSMSTRTMNYYLLICKEIQGKVQCINNIYDIDVNDDNKVLFANFQGKTKQAKAVQGFVWIFFGPSPQFKNKAIINRNFFDMTCIINYY